MANDFGFVEDVNDDFGFVEDDSEDNKTLEKVTNEIMKQAKGLISGINQMIPFSDQMVAASTTARQLLNGQIAPNQIMDAFSNNTRSALEVKQQSIKEAPLAGGVGLGLGAAGLTVATGGISAPINTARAGIFAGQSGLTAAGETRAAGGSVPQAVQSGLKSAALTTGLIGVGPALKGTGKVVDKVKTKVTGLNKQERDARKFLKVLGASKKQSEELIEEAPEIAQTARDQGVFDSRFTFKSKALKNAKNIKQTKGQQIGELIDNIGDEAPIKKQEVADNLLEKVKELGGPSKQRNIELIKKLTKKAKDFADEGTQEMSPRKAFEERVKWDESAFKSSKVFDKTREAEVDATIAQNVRDAINKAIEKRVALTQGAEGVDTLKNLNKTYSNIAKVEKVLKSNEFAQRSGPIDRLTIGAVLTAARSPGVAAGFFGGRELGRALGGRSVLGQPASFNRALPSLKTAAPSLNRTAVPLLAPNFIKPQ